MKKAKLEDSDEITLDLAEAEARAFLKIVRVMRKVKNPKMRVAILNLVSVQATGLTLQEVMERRES